jgi:hypothetical protein
MPWRGAPRPRPPPPPRAARAVLRSPGCGGRRGARARVATRAPPPRSAPRGASRGIGFSGHILSVRLSSCALKSGLSRRRSSRLMPSCARGQISAGPLPGRRAGRNGARIPPPFASSAPCPPATGRGRPRSPPRSWRPSRGAPPTWGGSSGRVKALVSRRSGSGVCAARGRRAALCTLALRAAAGRQAGLSDGGGSGGARRRGAAAGACTAVAGAPRRRRRGRLAGRPRPPPPLPPLCWPGPDQSQHDFTRPPGGLCVLKVCRSGGSDRCCRVAQGDSSGFGACGRASRPALGCVGRPGVHTIKGTRGTGKLHLAPA